MRSLIECSPGTIRLSSLSSRVTLNMSQYICQKGTLAKKLNKYGPPTKMMRVQSMDLPLESSPDERSVAQPRNKRAFFLTSRFVWVRSEKCTIVLDKLTKSIT